MQPFVCFVHIEKAGGITLHNVLHQALPGYLTPHPHPGFGEFFSKDDLQFVNRYLPFKVQGLGGHRMASFMDYESVLRQPIFYFTFLRDPIKRYMSHINWQISMMDMGWTMESFLADPEKENYHAYRIAGARNREKALAEIRRFQFVGLLEHYDESLVILRQRLGIPNLDFRYQKANTMAQKSRVYQFSEQPAAIQERIRQANSIDLELYELTREELYPRYRAEYQGDLERDVATFKASKANYQHKRIHQIKRKGSTFFLRKVVQPMMRRVHGTHGVAPPINPEKTF